MFKCQLALVTILIFCVAFISCERTQKTLVPTMPAKETMPIAKMMTVMDADMIQIYKSWMSVALPAPGALGKDTAPPQTGAVHGLGTRTVYLNESGVKVLKDASAETFPVGTMIVKDIMDDANTFVRRIAVMMKTKEPAFTAHNGWQYVQYQRETETAGFVAVAGDGTEKGSNGCHGCHAKVNDKNITGKDSVFVQLPASTDAKTTTTKAPNTTKAEAKTDGADAATAKAEAKNATDVKGAAK